MSRRKKLEKFADLKRFTHVYEMTKPGSPRVIQTLSKQLEIKGKWAEYAFDNNNPLCVELACGRGEYTVALARKNPDINYVGVDIKGARIWQGATIAQNDNLVNASFLRIRIEQLEYYFEPKEIDHIWITFPDPFAAKPNRRLTCANMLLKYHALLKENGHIHFKTDDTPLFDYTLEVLEGLSQYEIIYQSHDIYSADLYNEDLQIKTYYERQHLSKGRTIKYLIIKRV